VVIFCIEHGLFCVLKAAVCYIFEDLGDKVINFGRSLPKWNGSRLILEMMARLSSSESGIMLRASSEVVFSMSCGDTFFEPKKPNWGSPRCRRVARTEVRGALCT